MGYHGVLEMSKLLILSIPTPTENSVGQLDEGRLARRSRGKTALFDPKLRRPVLPGISYIGPGSRVGSSLKFQTGPLLT